MKKMKNARAKRAAFIVFANQKCEFVTSSLLETEIEDKYEIACLVIVRMRSSPWHVTQAGNSLSAARRQPNEAYKDGFCTSNSSRIIKTSCSTSVSSTQSIIAGVTRTFSLENT